jgi:serine/threonine-protein kinase
MRPEMEHRFVHLALEAGWLDQARLDQAQTLRAGQPHTPLPDLLVERGWLDPQQRAELEQRLAALDVESTAFPQADWARTLTEPIADVAVRGRFVLDSEAAPRLGGMGRVWLAHDDRLGRTVALKELRDETRDVAELRQRFLVEAQITAQLQHPGIAPVYELVRPEDGTAPFYTMRFVEGRTLTEAVRQFHEKQRQGKAGSLELRELLLAFVSVCNTLAYAHARGVVHRDLKGSNVMLGRYGEVVVLDWGLARVLGKPDDPAVAAVALGVEVPQTHPGVLGTPAYMAPEQALGQVERIDRRTDVFGLGALLHEVLTGQPPYPGQDRVLEQAQHGKVTSPRLLHRGVPRPLEAACLKALAERPEERYHSAAELADEVKRWLAGESVAAWPEPLAVKAGRWVRRHRVVAAAMVAAVLVTLVLGTAGGVYRHDQQQSARKQAREGLDQAAALREGFRFDAAADLLEHVHGWVRQAGDRQLQQRLAQAKIDLALARDLDRVRQEGAMLVEGKWDPQRVCAEYQPILARHRLDVLEGDLDHLAQTIRGSVVRESIIAALDNWARAETDRHRWQRLLQVANRADEQDAWRQAVRQALASRNEKRLWQLVRGTGEGKPTPGVVLLLAGVFGPQSEEATALLRRMQLERPRDFWVNYTLGYRLFNQDKHQEAAECFLLGVALRPDSAVAHYNLGTALKATGKLDEAIACFKKATILDPRYAGPHNNLGIALKDRGKVDEAIESFKKAIALDPRLAVSHSNLGNLWQLRGKLHEAIACYHRALAIDPSNAQAHYNLGNALAKQAKLPEAIASYRKAIAIDSRYARAHYNLGVALQAQGKVEEAIVCFRKVIELDAKNANAHNELGIALGIKGKVEEAIVCFRKVIELDPKFAWAHSNLGEALRRKGKVDAAIACFQRAITLAPRYAKAHCNLGFALQARGKEDEAIECYRKAITLAPRDANAHAALGLILRQRGALVEAEKLLRRCLELLPDNHPMRRLASGLILECQHLIDAGGKLKAFLAGKEAPADPASQVQMGFLAQQPFKRLYRSAARLYRDAFAQQPRLADIHRYNAACAAALAGTGQGKDTADLDDTARAGLRYGALSWLEDSLVSLRWHLASLRPEITEEVRKALLNWRNDPALAAVRDPDALGKLPEAEQVAWRNLWAEVDALIARATPRK